MSRPADPGPAPRALRTLATGAAMGVADLVPGFSGGTVALVAGVYPRLVGNIRSAAHVASLAVRLRFRDVPAALRALDWTFLALLLGSLLGAAFLLAATLRTLLVTEPVLMSAAFLGLVLGAAAAAPSRLQAPADARFAGLVIVSAAVTAVALGARPGALIDPSPLVLAATAAVAVCAMILPGVSGSFLLLLLGTYEHVIAAVADRDLVTLGVVAGGAAVGLLAFSTLLHWLLRRAHDVVLAVLVGLMIGSARVLWPWPATGGVGDPALGAPGEQALLAAVVGLVAFAAVVAAVIVPERRFSGGASPRGALPPTGPSPHGSH